MKQIEFRAMGSHMMAAIDVEDSPEADALLEQVPDWFERWEQSLSRFRPDSELSALNNAGYLPGASPTMAEVVSEALKAAQYTGGLVNPAMLPAVEAAGYDRTFDILDPDAAPGSTPFRPLNHWSDDWRGIEVNGREIRLPKGVRIDLGGIAKGWAADRAARRLGKIGPALVDAGGDISITALMAGGTPWPIGISDPFNPEEQLHLLRLGKCGVATSGRDYRKWKKGGANQHHIIDPRTGKPSGTDVFSATVIGPDTGRAEVAAKAAFLLGSQEGLEWVEKRPEFACLLVLESGEVVHSANMPSYFWPEAAG